MCHGFLYVMHLKFCFLKNRIDMMKTNSFILTAGKKSCKMKIVSFKDSRNWKFKGKNMPKVSEEYIIQKKKKIVESAYALCAEKTLGTVTMQDIINRTGLSQGGIYRFYRDIDEIFADMLVMMEERHGFKAQVDEAFSGGEALSVSEVLNRVFTILAEFMTEELCTSEKIEFELDVLAANAPQRVEKIRSKAADTGNMEYVLQKILSFFKMRMQCGEWKARVSSMELLTYIASAYSGIRMSCITNNCYRRGAMSGFYQPKMQFCTLARTVNFLLNAENEKEMNSFL